MIRAALVLVLTACSGSSADGQLVDGLTGEPIAGATLRAATTAEDPALSCFNFDATTDAEGRFSFSGLCAGAYKLKLTDESRWLAEVDQIPDGGATGLVVKAFTTPTATGVYRISGDTLEAVRSSTDLASEPIKGSAERVLYPTQIPKRVPVIAPEDHLVLVGADVIEGARFDPLIPSGPRVFGDEETDVKMDEWSYVGLRFTDDRTFERVAGTLDSNVLIRKEKGGRVVQYVPGSALPPGRYALYRADATLATIIDFGASQTAAAE